jgi:hypothetical protein
MSKKTKPVGLAKAGRLVIRDLWVLLRDACRFVAKVAKAVPAEIVVALLALAIALIERLALTGQFDSVLS